MGTCCPFHVRTDRVGEAVDAGAGCDEDTGHRIVVVSQVEEFMSEDDASVITEGAKTFCAIILVESKREGTAAGWECREEEIVRAEV